MSACCFVKMQPGIDDARIVEYQGTLRAYIFCDMPVCRFTDLVILIDQLNFDASRSGSRMQGNTVIRVRRYNRGWKYFSDLA